MADSLQFHLLIKNRSHSKKLVYKDVTLTHGNFNNPENGAKRPIKTVLPRETAIAMVVTGAENTATGTEGSVTYKVDGTDKEVTMSWDVPWVAGTTNTCKATSNDSTEDYVMWSCDPTSNTGRVLETTAMFGWQG